MGIEHVLYYPKITFLKLKTWRGGVWLVIKTFASKKIELFQIEKTTAFLPSLLMAAFKKKMLTFLLHISFQKYCTLLCRVGVIFESSNNKEKELLLARWSFFYIFLFWQPRFSAQSTTWVLLFLVPYAPIRHAWKSISY